jgi:hypothetical protein
MHWAARSKLSKQFETAIRLLARDIPRATGKRCLTIERHSRGMLDKDGAYGGCKPLIDAVKRCGLIIDDNPKHCDLEVVQVKLAKGEQPHTVIILADLTGFPVAKVS